MAAVGAIIGGLALLIQGLDELTANNNRQNKPRSTMMLGGGGLPWSAETDKAIAQVYLHHEQAADAALTAADVAVHGEDVTALVMHATEAKVHLESMSKLMELVRPAPADKMRNRIGRRMQRLRGIAEMAHSSKLEPMPPKRKRKSDDNVIDLD